ncbi:MAG: hypothetical protein WCP03_01325 [Candidatus Saccharibacteria bacterium]
MAIHKTKGFTIVETMLFLAVSGVFFVSISLIIRGQLVKHQTRDAIEQLESVVRVALNDVNNGYYPEVGNGFSCNESGVVKPLPNNVPDNRGTSLNCLLIGKSITFKATELTVDTWIALKTIAKSDSLNGMNKINQLTMTMPYKWGIKKTPATAVTYYIFNTNFGADNLEINDIYVYGESTDAFVSGSQATTIYKASSAGLPALDQLTDGAVCFEKDTNSNMSLIIAEFNSLTVKTDYLGKDC